MTDLPQTFLALAAIVSGWDLPAEAAKLERAAHQGGNPVTLTGFAPCLSGTLLWLLSQEGGECLESVRVAAVAVRATATDPGVRRKAEAVIQGVEEANIGSASAARFVRRYAA